ncbi:MAG: hypothetical protein ACI8RZ_003944 [Myxococcota bacterium]|jgi:hypothetical protein
MRLDCRPLVSSGLQGEAEVAVCAPELPIKRDGPSVSGDGIAVALLAEVYVSEEAVEVCSAWCEAQGVEKVLVSFAVVAPLPEEARQQAQCLDGVGVGGEHLAVATLSRVEHALLVQGEGFIEHRVHDAVVSSAPPSALGLTLCSPMLLMLIACSETPSESPSGTATLVDVTAVTATGDDGDWTFSVTLLSPDTGCEQYADWWEVLSPEGELLFRRILNHSHPDEQPFTRSGSPVPVAETDPVIVRAHLSPGGFGGVAMEGSVAAGFSPVDLAADFAASVEDADPQPDGCAF